MSIQEARRSKFESWAEQDGQAEGDYFRLAESGRYYWGDTQTMWEAWNAALDSISVALPPVPEVPDEPEEAIDDSHMDAYHSAIGMRHACAQFIKAAGLKVKI
jgi:hypothetical protein